MLPNLFSLWSFIILHIFICPEQPSTRTKCWLILCLHYKAGVLKIFAVVMSSLGLCPVVLLHAVVPLSDGFTLNTIGQVPPTGKQKGNFQQVDINSSLPHLHKGRGKHCSLGYDSGTWSCIWCDLCSKDASHLAQGHRHGKISKAIKILWNSWDGRGCYHFYPRARHVTELVKVIIKCPIC